ncbi:TerC family protein [Planctomicrobium piriforme]|uniref:Tellurite resistance protein TerC n=1 Tax=Planctomicrobium piriforme TaxID=1576369 RepID=A0A1I3K2N1_9PLAN|nr:TerC family protein [Planctomicrobium piriforme]SFI66771.1 tellurite resistance protein TerC [Planctomicrobium piriforme]
MPWWIYAAFVLLVTTLIVLDLSVLHRGEKRISVKKALGWTCFWISLAMLFNVFIYFLYDGRLLPNWMTGEHASGRDAAIQFFTGYLLEYSLSVDNIFVIALIIEAFRVPSEHQHRLLFWGILGAALLRGVMILAGATLMEHFEWTMYFFGALLIFSALRMAFADEEDFDPNKSFVMKTARKLFPVTHEYHGKNFFIIQEGKKVATPMLLALILIESCDVMFAVDSIPAVFGVTQDPFLVFTSNIFAILGLRSLYFALAGMMADFHYLKMALVVLLIFIGVKMLLEHWLGVWIPNWDEIKNVASLGVIAVILGAGIVASMLHKPKPKPPAETPETPAV